jgi:hypothetical protein
MALRTVARPRRHCAQHGSSAPALRATVLSLAALLVTIPSAARAAGTAYQVDTAETTEPGACKVESWASSASNRDFFAAINPACGFKLFTELELSAQLSRTRADDEWGTGLAPKAKAKLVPTAIGSWGVAVTSTLNYDLITGDNTAVAAAIPATLRVSDVVRINVNAGWQWDRVIDRHFVTYGVGVDWRTPDNVLTWTVEVFGQVGPNDLASVTQPRFQTGLRWRPIDQFSVDVIYGRNIYGENANWITVGTTIRFPAPER